MLWSNLAEKTRFGSSLGFTALSTAALNFSTSHVRARFIHAAFNFPARYRRHNPTEFVEPIFSSCSALIFFVSNNNPTIESLAKVPDLDSRVTFMNLAMQLVLS